MTLGWRELPWGVGAQKPGLMQISIGLQRAPVWLLPRLGLSGCSRCRQGTCSGCSPGHYPERSSLLLPMARRGGSCALRFVELTSPGNDVTSGNTSRRLGLLLGVSKVGLPASGSPVP